MSVFMVERDLKGITMEGLGQAQAAAIATSKEMTAEGTGVTYMRSVFSPSDGRCTCLFEADSSDVVKTANDRAGLPYHNIAPALDLPPPA